MAEGRSVSGTAGRAEGAAKVLHFCSVGSLPEKKGQKRGEIGAGMR